MRRSAKTDLPAERPSQDMPVDMVNRLLVLIRGQFCGDLSDKEWYQHEGFIRFRVICWPARFMKGKAFTLSIERYEAIFRSILDGIKAHGQTGAVRYWPGYLLRCVQEHWQHNWEGYYQEAKSIRSLAENVLLKSGRAQGQDRGVEALALAHQVFAGRRRKKVAKVVKQLNLFGA